MLPLLLLPTPINKEINGKEKMKEKKQRQPTY